MFKRCPPGLLNRAIALTTGPADRDSGRSIDEWKNSALAALREFSSVCTRCETRQAASLHNLAYRPLACQIDPGD
jgi:hypothetical protein